MAKMIKITIDKQDTYTSIKCKGHAHYNTIGKDIVCSGVSSLFQTLCFSLEELTKDDINIASDVGNAQITIYHPTKKSLLLVNSFNIGVREIEKVYSKYVQLQSNL